MEKLDARQKGKAVTRTGAWALHLDPHSKTKQEASTVPSQWPRGDGVLGSGSREGAEERISAEGTGAGKGEEPTASFPLALAQPSPAPLT